jgi:hypothetical protein
VRRPSREVPDPNRHGAGRQRVALPFFAGRGQAQGGNIPLSDPAAAGVYAKGQHIRTYVYGNLDRELTTTAILDSSTGPFRIGREPFGAGGSWWLGAMDDVAVYNRVLSLEELLRLSGVIGLSD